MAYTENAPACISSPIPMPSSSSSQSSLSPSSSSSSANSFPTGSPPNVGPGTRAGAGAGARADAGSGVRACSPPVPHVVMSPCAACKILRRKCEKTCVLAPYFPPTDPLKFTIAHKVFGASNIIKMLQELPEDQRADAVQSMVYEANARIRDPIYGCAGSICQLQHQISELQAELAKAKAEILNMRCQNDNLVSIICMGSSMSQNQEIISENHQSQNTNMCLDDGYLFDALEPLWA